MNLNQPATPRPAARQGRGVELPPIGSRQQHIEGRFVRITAHQLTMGWWLHVEGHITRRQLRVFFAAFEMLERRRYTRTEDRYGRKRDSKPTYRLEELAGLVGGRGSQSALADLRSDLRRLSALGLVTFGKHELAIAASIDQIAIEDLTGFWKMFDRIPNRKRAVPVPRRTLRALAGGFSRAVTGVMIALLIRSLFWHQEHGDYRTDGRTKASWIADVFGLSRRAVTDARAKLISLGWLEPLPASTWELNKWGAHDRIHADWTPEKRCEQGGESASPDGQIRGESASPCLNQSAPLTREEKETSTLGTAVPDPAGFSRLGILDSSRRPPSAAADQPDLRDIQPRHLVSTQDLLELHRQAVGRGWSSDSEAGRLDFLAFAERARARGNNPGGLLRWLLVNRRTEFITNADEDAAVERLRALRDGPRKRVSDEDNPKPERLSLTESERIVQACIAVGKQNRHDPYLIARQIKGWSRPEWEAALLEFDERQRQRWGRGAENTEPKPVL